MDEPITALQTVDCYWFVLKFIDMNFLKLTDNNQIFRNDFDCILYRLCTISYKITECKIFAPYDFLEMNSITTYSMLTPRTNSSRPLAYATSVL